MAKRRKVCISTGSCSKHLLIRRRFVSAVLLRLALADTAAVDAAAAVGCLPCRLFGRVGITTLPSRADTPLDIHHNLLYSMLLHSVACRIYEDPRTQAAHHRKLRNHSQQNRTDYNDCIKF
eukprot:scpid65885/ scgid31607/ 